jgi:hypothetical protein
MGLLDLADAILQKHEATGLSVEEEQLVAAEVDRERDAGLHWPEEEPAEVGMGGGPKHAEPVRAGEAAMPEARTETPGEQAPAVAGEPAGQPPSHLTAGEERVAGRSEPGDAFGAPTLGAPASRRIYDREEEQLPTFEGEPVEESSGWVTPAVQEELYSGWQEAIEEVPGDEGEWDREELEEEAPRAGKKQKKKKSGKSRFGRVPTRE